MLIDGPNKNYYIKLGGAITTNELQWVVNFLDTTRLQSLDGTTSGATPVILVNGLTSFQQPPINANKLIKNITVFNSDTVPQTVTVYLDNDSSLRTEVKVLLAVGYSLQYEAQEGWYVIDDNGARVNIEISLSGIAIGDTVLGSVIDKILYVDSAGTLQQITLGTNLSLAGSTLNAATMGGETLAQTLVLGNVTGGKDILVSNGDFISSSDGISQIDLGSATHYFLWTNDAGVEADAYIAVDTSSVEIGNTIGSLEITAVNTSLVGCGAQYRITTAGIAASSPGIQINTSTLMYLYHATKVTLDSPDVTIYKTLNVGLAGTQTGIIKLHGTTSGIVTITTPAIAGTWTLTLPNGSGSSGQFLQTDGAGITSWAASSTIATTISITDDNATNAIMYPIWVTANTGNLPLKVSSTKINFNPSTGSLGLGAVADSILTVSKQTTIVAPLSGTSAHYVGLDANPLRITYDSHNTGTSGTALFGRRSRGTASAPSALASGDTMFSLNALGYGASAYGSVSTGLISFKTSEAFTNTAQGTQISFFTTPNGSVTAAEVFRIGNDGGLNILATGGNGYAEFVAQSSNATAPAAAGFRLFAGATGSFNWVRKNGTDTYVRTFDATLSADRTYTLPDIAGTVTLGTGGTSRLSYWTGTNTVTGDSNTLINGTSYLFGYAALASTELAGFQKNQNAATFVAITNTTSATAGFAGLNVSNSSTLATSVFMRSFSALFTTSGMNVADTGVFGGSNAGGVILGTNVVTPLMFWSNSTERARILSSGELLIGYTALASTEIFGIQKNQNAATAAVFTNTTSGTAGRIVLSLSNASSGAPNISLQAMSAAFTTSGITVADTGVLSSSKGAGMNIGTTNATQLSFWTTNAERGRFNSTGEFGIGMTAVNILDITQTQNAASVISILNSNASTAASSNFRASNGTYTISLLIAGTGFTTSGLNVANIAKLSTTSTAGMILQSNVAATNIYIAIGGNATSNEVARFDANGLNFQNALMSLTYKVQSNSLVGRTTLVAGTKTVTITGLTTSHKAYVSMQAAGGTIGVIQAVCTANTLTLTSIVAGGILTQTLDTSTIEYFIVLTN